jgi:hypothetical protein
MAKQENPLKGQLLISSSILENRDIMLSSTSAFNLHVLLEQTETGRTIASIAELANCQVEADTRKEALQAIQELVSDRLSRVEVLPLEVSLKQPVRENPWTEFIGMFEGDAEFAQMAAQWQAERDQDADEAI